MPTAGVPDKCLLIFSGECLRHQYALFMEMLQGGLPMLLRVCFAHVVMGVQLSSVLGIF